MIVCEFGKMSWRKMSWNHNLFRCFSTSNAKFKVKSGGAFLHKMMSQKSRTRGWHAETSIMATTFKTDKKKEAYIPTRRVHVLNKLFMQHVTDLLSTGEISEEFLNCGLEVTHVAISPDYKLLRVFWYSRRNTDNFEKLLPKHEAHLRHELCQLKLMGIVPPVKFVKNMEMFYAEEVDKLLSSLDFERDEDKMKENEEEEEKVIQSEEGAEKNVDENLYACDVPEMTHSVLNVNHSYIMQKVKETMKKVKSAEERRLSNATMPKDDHPRVTAAFVGKSKEDMQMLKDYLKERKTKDRQKKLSSINAITFYKEKSTEFDHVQEDDENDDQELYDDNYEPESYDENYDLEPYNAKNDHFSRKDF